MFEILLSSATAFVITFFAIPSIIKVAEIKNLYDEPGHRKSHYSRVPTLGGLAIFAGVLFAFTFWSAAIYFPFRQYIISSMIILFFIGIKDDIVPLTPVKKFAGQIIAACIIVFFAHFRITNMHGIFGVYGIPLWLSSGLTLFTILVIINAVNLIDGIDGLAAGIGTIISLTFGIWFFHYQQNALAILSFSLFGALLAFLIFNFSPAKIFMGDTGSLIIGLILSILAINFIELRKSSTIYFETLDATPVMAIGVLIIPLFDLLRVFIIRISQGRSPFSADKNHIHHMLLGCGFSHGTVALILYGVNIGFIVLVVWLHRLNPNLLLGIIFLISFVLSLIPTIVKYVSRPGRVEPQK